MSYISSLTIKTLFFAGVPWAEEGIGLIKKAAEQGHAYAMWALGCVYGERNEHELSVDWLTKGAEAGLPRSMFSLGCLLDEGKGVAAPDYAAAVGTQIYCAPRHQMYSAPCVLRQTAAYDVASSICQHLDDGGVVPARSRRWGQ
jgi:TPR repeat protein